MASEAVEPSTMVEGWRMALLLLIFATVTLILEKTIHGLEHAFKKRSGLLVMLGHIKNELLMVGSISLLLSVFQEVLAKICISKPETSVNMHGPGRSLLAGGGSAAYCGPYKRSLWPVSLQHDAHIYIFVVACTHVVYGTITVYLTIWRVRTWRTWEVEARTKASSVGRKVVAQMPARWFYRNVGRNPFIHFFLMLLRQVFPVSKSLYSNARLLFIEKANLSHDYNFHDVVVKGLEDELLHTLQPEWHLWVIAVVWHFIPPSGHVSFWMYILTVLIIVLAGGKLLDILVQISVQIAINYGDSVTFGLNGSNTFKAIGRPAIDALEASPQAQTELPAPPDVEAATLTLPWGRTGLSNIASPQRPGPPRGPAGSIRQVFELCQRRLSGFVKGCNGNPRAPSPGQHHPQLQQQAEQPHCQSERKSQPSHRAVPIDGGGIAEEVTAARPPVEKDQLHHYQDQNSRSPKLVARIALARRQAAGVAGSDRRGNGAVGGSKKLRGYRVFGLKQTQSGQRKIPVLMRSTCLRKCLPESSEYVRNMLQKCKDRGMHELDAKNFFWFKRPRVVTMLFTLAFFQNSLSIATCIFSLTGMQDSTWQGTSKGLIVLQLCLDLMLVPFVGMSVLPLYALIQPLGTHCPRDLIQFVYKKQLRRRRNIRVRALTAYELPQATQMEVMVVDCRAEPVGETR